MPVPRVSKPITDGPMPKMPMPDRKTMPVDPTKMAKGGAVKKGMAKGGMAKKGMSYGGTVKKGMNMGGMAKKGKC